MPTLPGFTKRFSLPKMPARKAASMSNLSQLDASTRNNEFGLDYGVVKARLSGRNLVFKNGRWRVEEGQCDTMDESLSQNVTQLRSENKKLNEENNLLKFKVEVLLDMLTETTAEVQLQENEIEGLRSLIHRKSLSSYSYPAMSTT